MKTKVRKANIHQSLFWILFVSFLTPSVGLIVKDDCSNVHGKQNQIASITASSENLVVDDTQKDNFDGDSFRFKRPDAKTGFVSYTSEKGFENIEIEGYVFGGLPKASWSLKVLRVDFDESGSSKENEILRLTEENLDDFLVPNSNDDWKKFYLRLLVRKNCPSNLIIVLEGAASNNEYPGSAFCSSSRIEFCCVVGVCKWETYFWFQPGSQNAKQNVDSKGQSAPKDQPYSKSTWRTILDSSLSNHRT